MMATTTAAAIRDKMLDTVDALVPRVLSSDRFKRHREEGGDFRAWAVANPTAALRRVSIMDTGLVEPPLVTNTDYEHVRRVFEVVVAYPRKSARYGRDAARDLHDALELDGDQLDAAIGTTGYQTLDQATSGAATVITTDRGREDLPGVVFLTIRLSVQYYRSTT